MVYYEVQFLRPVENDWMTVSQFDETTGSLLPLSDSAEQLSLEDAQTRLMVLSRKYPFLTFRLNKVVL